MLDQNGCILLKNINCKLLSNLLILLIVPTAAIADNPPQPQKPSVNSSEAEKPKKRREPPSDYSRAGGSRGCPGEDIPLTVLAPTTFVGETTSLHPTLTWFVSKPQPTEISLFELDASTSTPKEIGVPIELESKSGINQLPRSRQQPALTVGTAYIWQVSIECPDNSPFVQRAEFRVVQKPAVLDSQLSRVTNSSQKAYIYAQQDLWYEALAEAFKVAPQGKPEQVGSDIVQNLAQSDSFIPQLTPDELEELNKEIQQRKNYLEKIAQRY